MVLGAPLRAFREPERDPRDRDGGIPAQGGVTRDLLAVQIGRKARIVGGKLQRMEKAFS